MELSVGWTRTCSLDSFFTKYLSGAMTLSKSISGFILATPDMNIGGGLLLPCFAESFSAASSVSVPNRFCVFYGFTQPLVGVFFACGCSCSSMFLILLLLTVCHVSADRSRVGCLRTLVYNDAFVRSLSLKVPLREVSLWVWVGFDVVYCEWGIDADIWFVGIWGNVGMLMGLSMAESLHCVLPGSLIL